VPPAAAAAAAAQFAILVRAGETAMQHGDVVGARSRYERAAALDPTSSTAAIAADETYDPHVLSLIRAVSPWFIDTAKAAAWYERARALGDPAAVGLLARLRWRPRGGIAPTLAPPAMAASARTGALKRSPPARVQPDLPK
jgi:TPR repeat protein